MWVEFVGSLLCPGRFFSRYSGIPLHSNTSLWSSALAPYTVYTPTKFIIVIQYQGMVYFNHTVSNNLWLRVGCLLPFFFVVLKIISSKLCKAQSIFGWEWCWCKHIAFNDIWRRHLHFHHPVCHVFSHPCSQALSSSLHGNEAGSLDFLTHYFVWYICADKQC